MKVRGGPGDKKGFYGGVGSDKITMQACSLCLKQSKNSTHTQTCWGGALWVKCLPCMREDPNPNLHTKLSSVVRPTTPSLLWEDGRDRRIPEAHEPYLLMHTAHYKRPCLEQNESKMKTWGFLWLLMLTHKCAHISYTIHTHCDVKFCLPLFSILGFLRNAWKVLTSIGEEAIFLKGT